MRCAPAIALIGMIQPDPAHPGPDQTKPQLFRVGCVGRITQLAESGDGRYLLQLTGVARFRVEEELAVDTPYRQCRVTYQPFIDDFTARKGEDEVDRKALLRALTRFPQGQQSQGRLGRHRERAQRSAGQCAGDDVALWRRREAGDAGGAGSENPRRDPGRRHRDRARQEQDTGETTAAVNAASSAAADEMPILIRGTVDPHRSLPMSIRPTPATAIDPKLLEILVCPLTKSRSNTTRRNRS